MRVLHAAAKADGRGCSATGDRSTEGPDDPDGGSGYHGWADKLADRVAAAQSTPLL